jgi:serine/threonine protein kinase
MAPQLLQEEEYCAKCDVWSLAFVYFEMLYGRTPWNGESPTQLYKNIMEIPLSFDPKVPVSDLSINFI